jgi:mono/diheme cytochrome c family protein
MKSTSRGTRRLRRGALSVAGTLLLLSNPARGQDVGTSGMSTFKLYCSACHGYGAKGDGPIADSLKVRPPDLTRIAKRNGGSFATEDVARIVDGRKPLKGHGGGDMPVWGDAFRQSEGGLSDEMVKKRIEAIAEFLQSIQDKTAK